MAVKLTHCGTCQEPFTLADFPEPPAPSKTPRVLSWQEKCNNKINQYVCGKSEKPFLVFVFPCGHIFFYEYLDFWINAPEKPCPNCNGTIAKDQVGKSYAQLMEIFVGALEKDPDIVTETLMRPTKGNSRCSLSQEDLPHVQITFDGKQFHHHEKCSKAPPIKIDDLVRIVKSVVGKHEYLKSWFTPTPLSYYRKFKLTYPLVHKALSVISFSGGFLALNRYLFNGQNKPLTLVGAPASIALLAVQTTLRAIAFILNSQER